MDGWMDGWMMMREEGVYRQGVQKLYSIDTKQQVDEK